MATSSRQSSLFGVQDWKKFYQTYKSADFQSFDYETLRKSFIDYIVLNYPENFNDYIESSEFVALLDVIAFMGQALAFRGDLNARENFIDTAERRDSVIKLANLVGYTPKRNLNAQGLLKITAISTTESVIDINGSNLSNAVILWNDLTNDIWQEQFNSIINAALVRSQRIGKPSNSQYILNVKTDEYSINIPPQQTPVVPFTAEIDSVIMDFELVSVSSIGKQSLQEMTPIPNEQMNFVYRNDKLGYGSNNTGFFFYFKQGTLQQIQFEINDRIENNTYQLDVQNINNNDTWLVEIDENNNIIDNWLLTENIYALSNRQIATNKKIFSVLSRTNDQVTYTFGDGVFGAIPLGRFNAYVRTSNGLTYNITPEELADITVTIDYVSKTNRIEQLTLTLSLQQTVTGALQRESIATIKERAPAKYYTQNRMVNGEDYNIFPFIKYSNILKSKAVNRTSVGVSRSKDLTDPTGKYSNTNIFSDDGVLYREKYDFTTSFGLSDSNSILEFFNTILPNLLSSNEVLQYYYSEFPRITGKFFSDTVNSDGKCYWKQKSVMSGNSTGYIYVKNENIEIPVSVGESTSTNLKFITSGAHIKFVSPAGKYFDKTGRLKSGSPTYENEGSLYIWAKVETIIGDGYNNGIGASGNGTGPVILNKFIPDGAIIDDSVVYENELLLPQKYYGYGIIPRFTNTFSATLVSQLNILLSAKVGTFKLVYDINLTNNWVVSRTSTDENNLLIKFTYVPNEDKYLVNIKNIKYVFSSEDKVKFIYNMTDQLVLSDTNQLITDKINILKINSNPYYGVSENNSSLLSDIELNVYGQKVFNNGQINDYSLLVSNINTLTKSVSDPDFYKKLVAEANNYVFFANFIDETNSENNILSKGAIITAYPTYSAINNIKYEYPPDTIFYAYGENKFFNTTTVPLTNPLVLVLSEVTNQYYTEKGTSGLKFNYVKNNNYYTRINPSTTNIIDLYVVTDDYYRDYQAWLLDSTDTVEKPSVPTMNKLKQDFSELDNYKMLSDNIILNSVVFKPVFGSKASDELRGIIKVIKNTSSSASESQIRSSVFSALNSYFTLDKWDFGDTFYFSELSAYLHIELSGIISSVVIVPVGSNTVFGDLYEIKSAPNEIFVNGATINDIIVINSLSNRNLQS